MLSVSGLFTVVVKAGGASPADGTVALFLDHLHVSTLWTLSLHSFELFMSIQCSMVGKGIECTISNSYQ